MGDIRAEIALVMPHYARMSPILAIKKEMAVTLSPLLPYVYDSYLLIYGRPGIQPMACLFAISVRDIFRIQRLV